MSYFQKFNLNSQILKNLEDKGYQTPTPIQEMVIDHILKQEDILGIAQTGTGKTAAFSLPIIEHLIANEKVVSNNCIRVLVLVPTRELASQIEENFIAYSKNLDLTSKVIFGGVSANPQIDAMEFGIDFVVATPGRLLDLMNQEHIKLNEVDIFVLDEADRMLDMGMLNDIKKIIKKLPQQRQTLFFSATMPQDIEELANTILVNPIKVEVAPESTTVEKVEQSLCYLSRANKPFLLAKVLSEQPIVSALVFSRTKHGADDIVKKLERSGIAALAIHGNKSQGNRQTTLAKFKSGEVKVLVATDIAARGIDIDHISHVINYNLPEDPSSYVHRIGRTARAGREGMAISFCDGSEISLLKSIEKHIRMKIPVNLNQPFHEEVAELEVKAGKTQQVKQKKSMSKKARRRRSFRG